jgi:hypothetical protein
MARILGRRRTGMNARVRLLLTAAFWGVIAALCMAAFHWWGHETWRQVTPLPVVMVAAGFFTEVRHLRREKRSAPLPPPPPL